MNIYNQNYDAIQISGIIGLSFYSIFVILSVCFMVYARTIFDDRIPNKGYGYSVPKPSKSTVDPARTISKQIYDFSLNKNPDRDGLNEGDECSFDGTPCKHPYTCGYKPGKSDELHCRHCNQLSCSFNAEISECCHGYTCVQSKFASDTDHRSSLGGDIGVCISNDLVPTGKYEGPPNNHNSEITVENDEIIKKHEEYWKNRKIVPDDKTKEDYQNINKTYKHPEHEELGAHALSNYRIHNNTPHLNYIDQHVKIVDDYEQCDNLNLLNKRITTRNRLRYNQEEYHVETPTCKEGSSCLYMGGRSAYCVPNHHASEAYNSYPSYVVDYFTATQSCFSRNMKFTKNKIDQIVKKHGEHFYRTNKPQNTYKYPKTNVYYSIPK